MPTSLLVLALVLPSRADLEKEHQEKLARVEKMLVEQKLGGVLVTQVRNFSWLTAGIADNHIVITSELGAASLLILRGGKRYVVASNSEIPRLLAEDLAGLGYEAAEFRWYEDKLTPDRKMELIRKLAGKADVGTDAPYGKLRVVDGAIAALRTPLTDSELLKYRWLGRKTTEAVVAVARKIKPGMTEREIEAMTSDELMRRAIRPTVILIGTDERILSYRHAPPSDTAVFDRYGMVNVCARRWGLVVAVTRLVHIGKPPPELLERYQVAAKVNAALQAASRPGVRGGDLLEVAKKAYAEGGHQAEWEKHHQGGAIGYGERDWVAFPGSTDTVRDRQAFAWNPTVMGAKVEDTVLLAGDAIENLTATPDWPVIETAIDGKIYRSPTLLVRRK
jgi:Xaa-Pro dipeptidase